MTKLQMVMSTLVAARSIDDFLNDSVDRFVACQTFCFWQLDTRSKGVIAWGNPTERDAREMVRCFEVGARTTEPHVSLVDMRDLRSVDIAAFDVIMRYMAERQPTFERTVVRQALLHGSGAIGAAVAGFYRIVEPTYPVAAFRDLETAVEWLAPDRAETLVQVVEALRGRVMDTGRIVALLRGQLGMNGQVPSAEEAARGLGMSLRTLQRELTLANTSFRRETARFRLESAERLLASSSVSVKVVARTLDTTPGRLSALFRRVHGVSAEGWRTRFR